MLQSVILQHINDVKKVMIIKSTLKEIISQTDLVSLSSKTFVFEDKMTRYKSIPLLIFSV